MHCKHVCSRWCGCRLHTITANLAVGSLRREVVNGTEYLVAPMTLIVPGVLDGSQGPLMYTPQDTKASTDAWDGVPLTVGHPLDPLTNRPLSADDPGVWDRQGIGYVKRPRFTDKLRAEGWFDRERTQQVSPQILRALMRGEKVEISTGLFTSNQPAPAGSSYNGKPFDAYAREQRPNHVAILPEGMGEIGACSTADGCGINNVARLTNNMKDQLRRLIVNAKRMRDKGGRFSGAGRGGNTLDNPNLPDADELAGISTKGKRKPVDNDQFNASQEAAHASVDAGHIGATAHAMRALDHCTNGNGEGACYSHQLAARMHEREATNCRVANDQEGAGLHDVAAGLHRKAASVHRAGGMADMAPLIGGMGVADEDMGSDSPDAGEMVMQHEYEEERCPRCGGEMEDGECMECGFVGNSARMSTDMLLLPLPLDVVLNQMEGPDTGHSFDGTSNPLYPVYGPGRYFPDGGTGRNGPGDAYSGADAQYGPAPPVRRVQVGKGRTVPQPRVNDDGDILPIPSTIDDVVEWRNMDVIKRRQIQLDPNYENKRRLGLVDPDSSTGAGIDSDVLPPPRMDY